MDDIDRYIKKIVNGEDTDASDIQTKESDVDKFIDGFTDSPSSIVTPLSELDWIDMTKKGMLSLLSDWDKLSSKVNKKYSLQITYLKEDHYKIKIIPIKEVK